MSDIKENKSIIQSVKVGTKCDVCGKEIRGKDDGWHSFSHRHYEWGNDSVDSVDYFDVCSVECYVTALKDSIDEMSGYRSAEIDDMSIGFAKNLYNALAEVFELKKIDLKV